MKELDDEPKRPARRRNAARAVGRAIGDAGLTVGISGGLTHGRGGGGKTRLDARAALFDGPPGAPALSVWALAPRPSPAIARCVARR